MKYSQLLTILFLTVSLIGCQQDKQAEIRELQTEPVLPPQDFRTQSSGWEADIDVSRLPQIITSVFKKLDIVLKQQDKKTGRYIFTGISPSGFYVTVEAISIIKNTSYIRVGVSGRQEDIIITKLLIQNVSNSLRTALRNQN